MHLTHINGKYINDDGSLDIEAYVECVRKYTNEVCDTVLKLSKRNSKRLILQVICETYFVPEKICMCKKHYKNDNTDWSMFE